jgi:FMN phosphatase YigB (HAD superfamily)
VLDFDGTLTDVDAGAPAFRTRFDRAIAAYLTRPFAEAEAAFSEVEATIDAAPERHAWSFRGAQVAPASADPYIRATCAAHLVFERFGFLSGDEQARADLIYRAHREAYQGAMTVFRDDARPVLEALLARLPVVHVVTNAATDVVSARLDELRLEPASRSRLRVVGDARKFVIETATKSPEAFAAMPESLAIPDLPRPVLLRRGHYFDAITAIARESSVRLDEVLACGDIFELDLALPFAMGAHIHLLTRATTPEYERRFVASSARGGVGDRLSSVLARLG